MAWPFLAFIGYEFLSRGKLGVGITTFIAWSLNANFDFALERAVTVLVIACPHALGLAIPLVVSLSTSIAAKMGFS